VSSGPEWLAPSSLDEALALRAERGADATVVAGGTFVGLLVSQRLLQPAAFLSLQRLRELAYIETNGELVIGAMTTHREVERSPVVAAGWPALAATFAAVANPRIRNQATVGGVLADADYASDPPAMLVALGARAVAASSWSSSASRGAPTAPSTGSSAPAPTRTAPAWAWPFVSGLADYGWQWERLPSAPSTSPSSARQALPRRR
jgi:xanthine dehydrogenase iron-sulfur cluster and FAD-binding subunit A